MDVAFNSDSSSDDDNDDNQSIFSKEDTKFEKAAAERKEL